MKKKGVTFDKIFEALVTDSGNLVCQIQQGNLIG